MPFEQPTDPAPTIEGYDDWWFAGKDDDPPKPRPSDVLLRGAGPATFQLIRSFAYEHPSTAKKYQVERHHLSESPDRPRNSTDFASVPSLFWWLIASYGHHTRAALIHDQLWDPPQHQQGDPNWPDREDANTIFRDALAESDVAFLRRWIMWVGVDAARRASTGLASVVWLVLEVVTVITFLVTAGFWALPHIWDLCVWLWGNVEDLGRNVLSPLEPVRDAWPSALGLGSYWLPLAVAGVGVLCWQYRWLYAALGLGLVLPPLGPELVSRATLYLLERIARPIHSAVKGSDSNIPSPMPTLVSTRATPRL